MQLSEREEATNYAKKQIDNFLSRRDYTSALLLACIYVDIRLTTLLTNRLSQAKRNWEEIATIVRKLSFSQKIQLCKAKGLLSGNKQTSKDLHKLREKRNKSAHESQLWRNPSSNDIREIKRICNFAKTFLEATNH